MYNDPEGSGWRTAWPDALAFVAGLGMAWWAQWRASDLVWSLWLSSLVVGYAMIVRSVLMPAVELATAVARDRAFVTGTLDGADRSRLALVGGIAAMGVMVVLAFFTLHFVGFHYVHSQLLSMLFPIDGSHQPFSGGDRLAMYRQIALRYWMFLPAAFVAERRGFTRRDTARAGRPSVTAEAIAQRKRALLGGGGTWAPYRQVMRMHFLIFFFVIAHFAHVDNFVVYAVVYAVYFFPWRLVRRGSASKAAITPA